MSKKPKNKKGYISPLFPLNVYRSDVKRKKRNKKNCLFQQYVYMSLEQFGNTILIQKDIKKRKLSLDDIIQDIAENVEVPVDCFIDFKDGGEIEYDKRPHLIVEIKKVGCDCRWTTKEDA